MKCRLPGPQVPAQAVRSPVSCASAPAAKAPASSWRIWTHSIDLLRRRESVMPFSESPATPEIRLTPAASRVSTIKSAPVPAMYGPPGYPRAKTLSEAREELHQVGAEVVAEI